MTQKLYTPEQVAEYLGVSSHKVACLLRSKQLGCAYVGSARRITDASQHFEKRYQLCIRQGPHRRGIKTYLIHATRPETQSTLL